MGKVIHLHRCSICCCVATRGIKIRGSLICPRCEAETLSCPVGSLSYEVIKARFKKLWFPNGRGSQAGQG